jgi:hypothetical protein
MTSPWRIDHLIPLLHLFLVDDGPSLLDSEHDISTTRGYYVMKGEILTQNLLISQQAEMP